MNDKNIVKTTQDNNIDNVKIMKKCLERQPDCQYVEDMNEMEGLVLKELQDTKIMLDYLSLAAERTYTNIVEGLESQRIITWDDVYNKLNSFYQVLHSNIENL